MRLVLLALGVLLGAAGCSAPPCRPVATACSTAPFVLYADPSNVDCRSVELDVAATRSFFEAERLEPGAFNDAFRDQRIYLHPAVVFANAEGDGRVGAFSAVHGIDLGAHGDAFPHELLHALDARDGRVFTGWHWWWDWEFDDEVTAAMSRAWTAAPVEAEHCPPP